MTSNSFSRVPRGRVICAIIIASIITIAAGTNAQAAITSTTQHGALITSFDHLLSNSDLIQGKNTEFVDVFELPFDSFGNQSNNGWHPANMASADRLAAFTDGVGMLGSGLTGLLNDFPPASGSPAKIVHYPLDSPSDIGRINILTGNNNPDGRIFSTTYVEYSTDNGNTFLPVGYFQSDPSGSGNNTNRTTLVSIFDDSSPTMLSAVTDIIFNLYSVSNTALNLQDPFDGLNAFNGTDDGFAKAFESPLVLELDVLAPSAGLTGDHNGDGFVDAADYVLWRSDPNAYGGDPQGYTDWVANFGASLGSGSGSVNSIGVPEPNTLAMLVVAAIMALLRRRQ